MLLKLVTCDNHVTICSNKDLLLKVVLFLTDYDKDIYDMKGAVSKHDHHFAIKPTFICKNQDNIF